MSRRVTVIVPVRNRAAMIWEAVASLLAQTRRPDAIIVIDDGSTDGTRASVTAFGDAVRILFADGVGPAAARNLGLAAAEGDMIGFLDSDDLWPEAALAAQLRAFDERPEAGAVWGMAQWRILPGGTALGTIREGVAERIVGVNSILFRRETLKLLGGFDPSLHYGEDHDLIRRCRAADIPIAEHDTVVAIHRRHPGNMTADRPAAMRGQLHAAAAALRAKRAGNL